MHYTNKKIDTNMTFGVDYFNQRVFGWEPLIEKWLIQKFIWQWSGQSSTLKVQPGILSLFGYSLLHLARNCSLNFNVTQTFIQQAKHFASNWPNIKHSLENDLRTMCVRLRSDHLLYLIRNKTGSDLYFTTNVEESLRWEV